MTNKTRQFYQDLATDYHLLFQDWSATVQRQAAAIDALLRPYAGDDVLRLLDCACGIGTQALGLAALPGYTVTGTDISAAEIERARQEATDRQLKVTFRVADMRDLAATLAPGFDVVIAFDNALPHLLTNDDLRAAARSIYTMLGPGGVFLASIRDYDALLPEKPSATSHRVIDTPHGRRIVFQLWDWQGEQYELTQFIVLPGADGWHLRHYTGTYRALRRQTLTDALTEIGFREVTWLMPDESGYYQPIVIGRR